MSEPTCSCGAVSPSSARYNEEGRAGGPVHVIEVPAPHEPSQCCQSAARTALLEAAAELYNWKGDVVTVHDMRVWLRSRAGDVK